MVECFVRRSELCWWMPPFLGKDTPQRLRLDTLGFQSQRGQITNILLPTSHPSSKLVRTIRISNSFPILLTFISCFVSTKYKQYTPKAKACHTSARTRRRERRTDMEPVQCWREGL